MISNVSHSLFSFCLRNEMKKPFVIHVREAPKRWNAIIYFLKKKTGWIIQVVILVARSIHLPLRIIPIMHTLAVRTTNTPYYPSKFRLSPLTLRVHRKIHTLNTSREREREKTFHNSYNVFLIRICFWRQCCVNCVPLSTGNGVPFSQLVICFHS